MKKILLAFFILNTLNLNSGAKTLFIVGIAQLISYGVNSAILSDCNSECNDSTCKTLNISRQVYLISGLICTITGALCLCCSSFCPKKQKQPEPDPV